MSALARKVLGLSFFSNYDLQQSLDTSRSTIPLNALGDFSNMFDIPILPTLLAIFATPNFAPPDWWPVLPFSLDNPGDPTSWIGSPGNPPIDPRDDPFYHPDISSYENLANGEIIDYREVGLSVIWVNINKAYQISYRTESTFGWPQADVTTVMIPNNVNGKVVSYQNWEDAASLQCSPSYSLITGIADPTFDLLLLSGYIVNTPDHEGKNSSFVAGIKEGKSTLDSLKAYLAIREKVGIEDGDKIILWGYSGGTIASGHALELQGTYAPELNENIVGACLGGFVTNASQVLNTINGGIFAGFGGAGVIGLGTEYPAIQNVIDTHVRPGIKWRFNQISKVCIIENLINNLFINIWSYTDEADGSLINEPAVQEILENETLGVRATPNTSIPLMVYQGVNDEIVAIGETDRTVDYYCQNGVKVDYYRLSVTEHILTMILAEVDVLKWIHKVFYDGYSPAACSSWQDATFTTVTTYSADGSNFNDLVEGNWEAAGVLSELGISSS